MLPFDPECCHFIQCRPIYT